MLLKTLSKRAQVMQSFAPSCSPSSATWSKQRRWATPVPDVLRHLIHGIGWDICLKQRVSLAVPRRKRVTSARKATTQKPIRRKRGLTQNSRTGNPKRKRPNCHCKSPRSRGVGTPRVCRPADFLPPGTVGQYRAMVDLAEGAATLEPTKRSRELTQNSRAGIPKRLRPNCQS